MPDEPEMGWQDVYAGGRPFVTSGSSAVFVTSGSSRFVAGTRTMVIPRGTTVYVGGFVTSGSPGYSPEEQAEYDRRRERLVAAENKSRVLWDENLTPAQLREFESNGYVTLKSKGGLRYRIRRGTTYNVDLLNWLGRVVKQFCLQTVKHVPVYDQMLVQKLMIEHEEKKFWEIANKKDERWD